MQGRRWIAAILAGAALALPAAAWAETVSRLVNDTTLLLGPGERVILDLAHDGRLTIVSVASVDIARIVPPQEAPPAGPGGRNPLMDAPPGRIAFTYALVGEDTLMKVENATEHGLDYRATLMDAPQPPANGRTTSVCTVRPNLVGFEYWPKLRVAAIMLTGFARRQTEDAVCSDPNATAKPERSPQTD